MSITAPFVPLRLDRLVDRADYAIIGPRDDRRRVLNTAAAPYNSVCAVERDFGTGRWSGCTGFLVAPDLVITAGHCLHSHRRGGAPRRIRVTPGRDQGHRPFGSVRAARWGAHPRFVASANPAFDFGWIRLVRPLPAPRPAFRLTTPSNAALTRIRQSRLLHIAGYPSDKPTGQMWSHVERLDGADGRLLRYSIDTCPGHSGAPVWLQSAGAVHAVIGIHTRGPRPSAKGPWGCRPGAPMAPSGLTNSGIRLTPAVLRAIALASATAAPDRHRTPRQTGRREPIPA
ncbi:MAG: serine protease [Pseudomonadota bacterium]